jgi:hypothetical protein
LQSAAALSVPVEAHDQPVAEPHNDGQGEVGGQTRVPHAPDESIGHHDHVRIVAGDQLVQQQAP